MITKTQNFILKAKHIHEDKYDYSLVEYNGSYYKVSIICKIHGIFKQSPNNHLNGQGCAICGRIKTQAKQMSNVNDVIAKAKYIHKNKYDYSLVQYKNEKSKIKIICPTHGIFEQTPDNHINNKTGCPSCSCNKKLTPLEYITKVNLIHKSKYNYLIMNYCGVNKKIKIICPIHGVFEIKASHHASGVGCSKCSNKHKYTTNEFIIEASKIHGSKYSYKLSEYLNAKTKIIITCPMHGDFMQSPTSHLSGKGCPTCNESKGEKAIRNYLNKHNISFIPQHKFNDCKNIKPLPFDFYLPDYNTCIEYQGEQHYRPIKRFGGVNAHEKLKENDNIKKEYCESHNILLIVISNINEVIYNLKKLIIKP